jgi:predicted nucleic acid-binding protein
MGRLTAISGKKVYLDTNLFIYALEAVEPWFAVTVELLSSIDVGYATALTSEFTLAECLVKPYRLNRMPIVKAYEDLLRSRPYFFVHRSAEISSLRLQGCVPLSV